MPVRSRLSVNTAEAAIDAAVAGVGITRVLSYQVASALADGRLATLLEEYEPTPWPVSLVHTGQSLLPLKLRAFLDFAAPRLKAAGPPHRKAGALPGTTRWPAATPASRPCWKRRAYRAGAPR